MFPRGQFARNMALLHEYENPETDDFSANLRRLIALRESPGYDNGEYLTQGILYHEGRSCVFSLKALIDAGLCKLYPEFNDEIGKRFWTNRVKQLRSQWSGIRSTNAREMIIAVTRALRCFAGFDSVDMILMLLTLKNRKQKGRAPLSPLASRPSDGFCTEHKNLVRGSLNRYGPQEVQRFIETCSDFNSDLLRLAAT